MQLRLKAVIDQCAKSTAECLCDLSAARVRAVCIGLLLLLIPAAAHAQVTVKTVAGGRLSLDGPDAGFQDGDALQSSQFNTPAACAVDDLGNIYIADTGNGALRKLDVAANRCRTLVRGLSQPVAVAVASTNSIFVLTLGDRQLREFDRFGNQVKQIAGFFSPVAIATDTDGTLVVAESSGSIVRVNPAAVPATVTEILTGVSQPGGVAVLDSGVIAVSETGGNRVRFIDPVTGVTVLQVGSEFGTAGFQDGVMNAVRFNQPQHLAKAPNGSIIVADRGNHRVRLIALDGSATTVYGKDPRDWFSDFPGWEDGSAEIAEACEPSGVAVAANTIYTTELCYHIVRQVTGIDLSKPTGGGGGGGTTNAVVASPKLAPNSGYFPTGTEIVVTSDSGLGGFGPGTSLFYTIDGSDPTTNSLQIPLRDNIGRLFWRDGMRDLTALRVKAFSGTNSSITIAGAPTATNQIGIASNLSAGIGSTIIIPVVANLRAGEILKSVQFVVDVTPNGAAKPITSPFRTLPIGTNDFVPIRAASTNVLGATGIAVGSSVRLPVAYVGTNAVFTVENFATVAMLALPIPTDAAVNDTYTISVLAPSGTSDGLQTPVPLSVMASRTIRVANNSYLVGDSSPGGWYNAGEFGNLNLDNSEVNNAFYASLGVRVPYVFSDVFDAMDSFPEDVAGAAGGDGKIRFLDWQVILQRSLRLAPNNWLRSWSPGGIRMPESTNLPLSNLSARSAQLHSATGAATVWWRDASIGALPVGGSVLPGSTVDVPIYVNVAAGNKVAGLAFRAAVTSEDYAPLPEQGLQFVPAPGKPAPITGMGPAANILLCGWASPLNAFNPALEGSTIIGSVRFDIPATAQTGQHYKLSFAFADGSPDNTTEYNFETIPGFVSVNSPALPREIISDEWKTEFFGTTRVAADGDSDADGFANLDEYLAGTNPADAGSRLQLAVFQPAGVAGAKALRFQWLSARGRTYRIESCADLKNPVWTVLAGGIAGTGGVLEAEGSTGTNNARFYRVKIE